MTKLLTFIVSAVLAMGLSGTASVTFAEDYGSPAQDDGSSSPALDQLEDAAQDGQEAVEAPTDEGAKAESNETFDTPHDSDGD